MQIEIETLVRDLVRQGFFVMENKCFKDTFGNRLVILESPTLAIRITSDRNDVFVELAPAGRVQDWNDIRHFRKLLMDDGVIEQPVASDDLAGFLVKNLEVIVRLLSPSEIEATVSRLRENQERERSEFLKSLGVTQPPQPGS